MVNTRWNLEHRALNMDGHTPHLTTVQNTYLTDIGTTIIARPTCIPSDYS